MAERRLAGIRDQYADDKQFIMSLAKGLELLRAFEPQRGMLGNSDLADICQLPKATIARITYTLVRLGYLEAIPQIDKYRLSGGVLALGHAYLGTQFARSIAAPLLADLSHRHDLTAALGVRDRMDIIYIEVAYGRSLRAIRLDVGSRVPLAQSAIGLAYIAALDLTAQGALMAELEADTPADWRKTAARIAAAKRELQQHGFCRSTGVLDQNIAAAGAPVRGLPDAPPMVVNVAAPSFGPYADGIPLEIGHELAAVAAEIGQRLIQRGEPF